MVSRAPEETYPYPSGVDSTRMDFESIQEQHSRSFSSSPSVNLKQAPCYDKRKPAPREERCITPVGEDDGKTKVVNWLYPSGYCPDDVSVFSADTNPILEKHEPDWDKLRPELRSIAEKYMCAAEELHMIEDEDEDDACQIKPHPRVLAAVQQEEAALARLEWDRENEERRLRWEAQEAERIRQEDEERARWEQEERARRRHMERVQQARLQYEEERRRRQEEQEEKQRQEEAEKLRLAKKEEEERLRKEEEEKQRLCLEQEEKERLRKEEEEKKRQKQQQVKHFKEQAKERYRQFEEKELRRYEEVKQQHEQLKKQQEEDERRKEEEREQRRLLDEQLRKAQEERERKRKEEAAKKQEQEPKPKEEETTKASLNSSSTSLFAVLPSVIPRAVPSTRTSLKKTLSSLRHGLKKQVSQKKKRSSSNSDCGKSNSQSDASEISEGSYRVSSMRDDTTSGDDFDAAGHMALLEAQQAAPVVPEPPVVPMAPETPEPSSPPVRPKKKNIVIEIQPGYALPLIASQDTMQAVADGFVLEVYCKGCFSCLNVRYDCDFVVCPECRVVSPVEDGPGAYEYVGLGLIKAYGNVDAS